MLRVSLSVCDHLRSDLRVEHLALSRNPLRHGLPLVQACAAPGCGLPQASPHMDSVHYYYYFNCLAHSPQVSQP